jgi:hypothetical protein
VVAVEELVTGMVMGGFIPDPAVLMVELLGGVRLHPVQVAAVAEVMATVVLV